MEPLFWILFCGTGAIFIIAILSGIVVGVVNLCKTRTCENKYIEQGIITKKQKGQLAEILLQESREALECKNFGTAFSYINDSLNLCKWNDNKELEKSANFELARYFAAKGNIKRALDILSSLYTPHAYLLRGELLLKQDPRKNYGEIARCVRYAMEYEELKDGALDLFIKCMSPSFDEKRENDLAAVVEETEHEKHIKAIMAGLDNPYDQEHFAKVFGDIRRKTQPIKKD